MNNQNSFNFEFEFVENNMKYDCVLLLNHIKLASNLHLINKNVMGCSKQQLYAYSDSQKDDKKTYAERKLAKLKKQ